MNIKNKVLLALENKRGCYVSGEALAAQTGVSRQYISKTVKSLIEEGYAIKAVQNRGYLLSAECDLLSAAVITEEAGVKVHLFESIDSTSRAAKEIYCREGECLVLSEQQTAGVKKDGSNFPSPKDKGLYMTAAIDADISLNDIQSYRARCAEAVRRAIERACGVKADVKNTDDIFVGESKVCGILTECMLNAATMRTRCVFVGVGIYTGKAEGVTAYITAENSRNALAADIFKNLKALS